MLLVVTFTLTLLNMTLCANIRNDHHDIGDMMFNENQFSKAMGNENGISLRSGNDFDSDLWPKGELPYRLSSEFNAGQKKLVTDTIAHFNSKFNGCIKIREKTRSDTDYVDVTPSSGSCGTSEVGRQGNKQILTLRPNCLDRINIMHEFIHAFGFIHEHNRSDRDKFIEIHKVKLVSMELNHSAILSTSFLGT